MAKITSYGSRDTDWAALRLLSDWSADVRENWPTSSKPATKLLEELKEIMDVDK